MKTLLASLIYLFVITTSSFAMNPTDSVIVKYAESIHNKTVVHIMIANSALEELEVVLRDDDGTFLYSDRFTSLQYSKKFLLNTPEDFKSGNLNIAIKHKATGIITSYSIPIVNQLVFEFYLFFVPLYTSTNSATTDSKVDPSFTLPLIKPANDSL